MDGISKTVLDLDLTMILDMACLSAATALTALGVHSLRMLARIRLERSLFIPVIMSAAFFWSASLVNLVFNLYVENVPSFIVAQASISVLSRTMQLLGLSTLTYGVFTYWRITRNVRVPKHERKEKHKEPQIVTDDDSITVEQVSEQTV